MEVESPFTNKKTSDVWGKVDGRVIYKCPDTGAIFLDRNKISERKYEDYGVYPYLEEFDRKRVKWELKIRRGKYQRQLETMDKYAPGKKLLDIGAGPGYFCRVAEEKGWDVQGVEISKQAVQFGQNKFDISYTDIEEIEEKSIDAITCHHVLEHIPEPMDFLETIRNKMKEGGLLVLHVPHQQPLTFLVRDWVRQIIASENKDTFCTLYGNTHISGFTEESLQNVLCKAGLEKHFSTTAGMWTKYYDPFFAKNYIRNGKYLAMIRKFVRHLVERAGEPLGLGDWVIGYFYREDDLCSV